MDGGAREELVLDQFVQGLNDDEMAKHVVFGHPTTLDSALDLAMEYDMFVTSRQTKNTSHSGKVDRIMTDDMAERLVRLETVMSSLTSHIESLEQRTETESKFRQNGDLSFNKREKFLN